MFTVGLNKGEEKDVLAGFPWIYNNEVAFFEGTIENGQIVKVVSFDQAFVCYGMINLDSKIMIRVLSLSEEVPDESFFKKRMQMAIDHRQNLGWLGCCRLIFAEADGLPGLIVDQYGDCLVMQVLCLGMEKIKPQLVSLLVELLHPKSIYERSDAPIRLKEGLDLRKGFLYGTSPTQIEVTENGILLRIDIENGQKTGYFLDQKKNRMELQYYVKDKVVLDCFSHTGGFALHAALYGAKQVDACDISQKAVEDILYHAKLNHFDQIHAICTDVFDYLRQETIKDRYDVIILDPPAFTKSKDTVKNAYRGYKEINLQALKNLKKGGYLFTFSCSYHMTPTLFMDMINKASIDSKRRVQMVDFKIQAADHPVLLEGQEQLYLKCMILRVLD